MSVHHSSTVWKSTHIQLKTGPRKLRPPEKLIALHLADNSGTEAQACWSSHGRLADECGLNLRTVRRVMRGFLDCGFLTLEKEADNPRHVCRQYRMNLSLLVRLHEGVEPPRNGSAPRGSITPSSRGSTTPLTVLNRTGGLSDVLGGTPLTRICERTNGDRSPAPTREQTETELELELVQGLVFRIAPGGDARLASDVISDCRKANREVTTEHLLVILNAIATKGVPQRIRNKAGWLRTEAAGRARTAYLYGLQAAVGARMEAAINSGVYSRGGRNERVPARDAIGRQ